MKMCSIAEFNLIRLTAPTLFRACFHALTPMISDAATQVANHGRRRICKQLSALIVKRAS
jgi:hypothetical protein